MSNQAWYRVGLGLTVLSVLFLLMDGGMKVLGAEVSIQATTQLGFSPSATRTLGVVLLIATALYALPMSSVLGAVLLTAYLGGAVAIQWRQGNPWGSHILFGVYVGLMVWGGVWLRMPALRNLMPFTTR